MLALVIQEESSTIVVFKPPSTFTSIPERDLSQIDNVDARTSLTLSSSLSPHRRFGMNVS